MFEYQGYQYTLEELQAAADAAGISLEEYIAKHGIKKVGKQEGVAEKGATVTPITGTVPETQIVETPIVESGVLESVESSLASLSTDKSISAPQYQEVEQDLENKSAQQLNQSLNTNQYLGDDYSGINPLDGIKALAKLLGKAGDYMFGEPETVEDVGFVESMYGILVNGLNTIGGVDTRAEFTLASLAQEIPDELFTTALGEKLGKKAIEENNKFFNKTNQEMDALAEVNMQTLGFKDIGKKAGGIYVYSPFTGVMNTEDIKTGIAATANGISQFLTSAAISYGTGGVGLASDMVAYSIKDYNDSKAEELGITTEELFNTGQGEVVIPAALGTVGYLLERAGIKGWQKALKNMTPGAKKALFAFLNTGTKEGGTEWVQGGIEELNRGLGAGRSYLEAEESALNYLFSEDGVENFLQGFVGGTGSVAITRASRQLRSGKDHEAVRDIILELNDLENSKFRKNLTVEEIADINTAQEELRFNLRNIIDKSNTLAGTLSDSQIENLNANSDFLTTSADRINEIKSSDKFTDKEKEILIQTINKRREVASQNIFDIRSEAEQFYDNLFNVREAAKEDDNIRVLDFKNAAEIQAYLNDNPNLVAEGGRIAASGEQGFFIPGAEDSPGTIIINREKSLDQKAVNVASHEFLHYILNRTMKKNPMAAINLGNALLRELDKIDVNKIKDSNFKKRMELYKDDKVEIQMEEALTLFSDALATGDIQLNADISTLLGDKLRRTFGRLGVNVKFNEGSDVVNFIKDYNNSLSKGKLTKGQQAVLQKGAEGKLIPQEEQQADEQIIKESKGIYQEVEAFKDDLVNEQSKDATAFLIADKLQNEVDRRLKIDVDPETREDIVRNFLFNDKRGLLGLLKNYSPARNESIMGYLNSTTPGGKLLDARLIEFYQDDPRYNQIIQSTTDEAVQRKAEKVTSEDITETTTEGITDKPLAKKPTETIVYSDEILSNAGAANTEALETRITEEIQTAFKDKDISRFKELKDIPKNITQLYADMFGLSTVDGIVDFKRNFPKLDEDAVRKIRTFLSRNAEDDFRRFPKTKDDQKRATGVKQTKLGKVMYDANDNFVGTLKQYKDILQGKNITLPAYDGTMVEFNRLDQSGKKLPLYRDSQHYKAALKFHIQNRIAEDVMPDKAQRLSAGLKFSKAKAKPKVEDPFERYISSITKGEKELSAEQIEQEISYIKNLAQEQGVEDEDIIRQLFTNDKNYKQLRSTVGVPAGGKNKISSVENAVNLRQTQKDFVKKMIPEGKTFDQLPKQYQQFIIDTVGFGDTRMTLAGVPLTYKAYNTDKNYSSLLTAAFGEDVLTGTGKNISNLENVFAPRNWGQKGFRGKVEQIVKQEGITPEQAKVEVEKLLVKEGNNIDETLAANIQVVNNAYDALADMVIESPNSKTLESIVDLLESQVNRATGVFKGLIPVTSFSMKPERGTTKNQNKEMHNEHLVELFNANKNFINLLNQYIKGSVNQEQLKQKIKENTNSLEQAVIPERLRVEKDASGSAIRDFADPLTFLGKDADDQVIIGTRKLVTGETFTGLNMAEFIAKNLTLSQMQQLARFNRNELNSEGVIVKQIIDNKKNYIKTSKSNNSKLPDGFDLNNPKSWDRFDMLDVVVRQKFPKTKNYLYPYEQLTIEEKIEVVKAIPGLQTTAGLKFSKSPTNQDIINVMKAADIAVEKARDANAPNKGISVWDFDDTLATTKSNVLYTMPDGSTGTLNAEEFAAQGEELGKLGAEFDFSEFEKVTKGAKGPMFEKAIARNKKFGNENVFILTARTQSAAKPIHEFLKSIGLDIPLKNIVGLGNSSPQAKARWIVSKAGEGYNDFYFADDAYKNVKAVQDALSILDVKSKVRQAYIKHSKSEALDKGFNDILEQTTGIASEKEYKKVKAEVAGASLGRVFRGIPYSAQDFVGLLYETLSKGKLGDSQMAWYNEHLIKPYARAVNDIDNARLSVMQDYRALKKQLGFVPKKLRAKLPGEPFTREQAVRVYIWNTQGYDIPGISKQDLKDLVEYVQSDSELEAFAKQVIAIQKGEYAKPKEGWPAGTITTDIQESINKGVRAKYLTQWQNNVDVIFSEKNMNKLEAAYGKKYRKAMENMLDRMKTGRNRRFSDDSLTGRFTDWLQGSVGAIMFFNSRSALLQNLSSINFLNFTDNNPLAAAKAFANQKQYWSDFSKLINSDFLKARRSGLRMNVNEADIADMAKKGGPRAVISKLLQFGFTPTQVADSFAIASGGATFYRNRIKSLMKQGMSQAEAETQAFEDFRETAEESQQSARPDRISMQQAGPLGRLILAFQNTPSQYARIIDKSIRDLKNRRGDAKTNISKIIYYSTVQNLMFNALQQALFAFAFDDEEPEEEEKKEKYANILNSMADSLLRGTGVAGGVLSVTKNAIIRIIRESQKDNPNYEKVGADLQRIAPPISSKLSKINQAARSFKWDKEQMINGGWGLDNPAYLAVGNVVSATTNLPMDRAVKKINNLMKASDSELELWERLALLGGWQDWEIGLDEDPKPKKKKPKGRTEKGIVEKGITE